MYDLIGGAWVRRVETVRWTCEEHRGVRIDIFVHDNTQWFAEAMGMRSPMFASRQDAEKDLIPFIDYMLDH